jgi:AcrR family transcriptional regulator
MAAPAARNTTRHREAGAASRAETRRRLLQAAGEEFAERGYHAATVNRIAARAGVTVQTLYLAWGSKRALLRAYMDAALSGSPDMSYIDELPHLIDGALGPAAIDARSAVKQIAHLYREVAERAALGWRLYRDAAASDAAVAADWQTLQRMRHNTFAELIRRIPAASLRAEVTPDAATDTAWAIASPETYELLVRTAEFTLDQYEQWVAATLCSALLAPESPPSP